MDAALTDRVLTETARIIGDVGYGGLHIEHVAARAGCAKTTIYRRWGTKAELAVAAISNELVLDDPQATGQIIPDLVAHAATNLENQLSWGRSHRQPLAAATIEPDIRALIWQAFMKDRRALGQRIIAAAIADGQLPPETDAHAMLDLISGFILFRMAGRLAPTTEADLHRVISALVASPPLG